MCNYYYCMLALMVYDIVWPGPGLSRTRPQNTPRLALVQKLISPTTTSFDEHSLMDTQRVQYIYAVIFYSYLTAHVHPILTLCSVATELIPPVGGVCVVDERRNIICKAIGVVGVELLKARLHEKICLPLSPYAPSVVPSLGGIGAGVSHVRKRAIYIIVVVVVP